MGTSKVFDGILWVQIQPLVNGRMGNGISIFESFSLSCSRRVDFNV